MSRRSRFLTSGFLFIAAIIAVFIFAFRSCLSQYDERSALPPVAYIEKDGKALLISIVQFSKASSYSRSGGFVRKTVSNEYYVQTNDAVTGKKIGSQEIDLPSRIKQFPLEIIGTTGTQAWMFVNQLMAYDAFTLKRTADIEMLEEKNPSLKDKFPAERKYYKFITATGKIKFIATDGAPWVIDTKTLLASPDRAPKEEVNNSSEVTSRIRSLERLNTHFGQIKLNQDTADGKFMGMYSANEFSKLTDRIYINNVYGEDERRQLILGRYDSGRGGQSYLNKATAKVNTATGFYLDGGFLLDKKTGLLIQLVGPGGYLLVSKDQIGTEGKIIITRISYDGFVLWKCATNLSQWADWQYHGDRLYIFGCDNKELSSSECNLLLIVDLKNGSMVGYDFFTDKNV